MLYILFIVYIFEVVISRIILELVNIEDRVWEKIILHAFIISLIQINTGINLKDSSLDKSARINKMMQKQQIDKKI